MALSTLALMLAYAPTLTAVTVLALALYSGVLMALRPWLRRQAEATLLTGVEMERRVSLGPLPGFGQRSSTEWCPSWLTALRRPAPRARRRDGGRGVRDWA